MEVFRSDMSDIETAIRLDRSMISSVEGQIRMFAHSMIEPNFFEMLTNFYHPLPIFLMSFLGCLCSLFGYSLVFFHSSKIFSSRQARSLFQQVDLVIIKSAFDELFFFEYEFMNLDTYKWYLLRPFSVFSFWSWNFREEMTEYPRILFVWILLTMKCVPENKECHHSQNTHWKNEKFDVFWDFFEFIEMIKGYHQWSWFVMTYLGIILILRWSFVWKKHILYLDISKKIHQEYDHTLYNFSKARKLYFSIQSAFFWNTFEAPKNFVCFSSNDPEDSVDSVVKTSDR